MTMTNRNEMKKMMLSKLHLFLVVLLILVYPSCKTNNETFHGEDKCFLYMSNEKIEDNKIYNTFLVFSDNNCTNIVWETEIYKEDKRFFIRIKELETKFFVFFDFSTKKNESYYICLEYINDDAIRPDFKTKAIVENIINYKDDIIYIFRVKNIYCYENFRYDVVFFSSLNKGTIGSYISVLQENNFEYIIGQQGNYLQDVLDYSDKIFTTLK